MLHPMCVILGQPNPAFRKRESMSSMETGTTMCTSQSALPSLMPEHSCLKSDNDGSLCVKIVTFDIDYRQDNDAVREDVYEYPRWDEQDKKELFWSNEELAACSMARKSMIEQDCQDRTRFIACVEEIFQLPSRMRRNLHHWDSSMSDEHLVDIVVSSDYRGFEQSCCRAIVKCRKRVIQKVMSSCDSRTQRGKEANKVVAKLSWRQVQFAYLVAQGDAQNAAEYLGVESL